MVDAEISSLQMAMPYMVQAFGTVVGSTYRLSMRVKNRE